MTRLFDKYWTKTSIVEQMKARAQIFVGRFPNDPSSMQIIDKCRAQHMQPGLVTTLIYTMDTGMHTSGWWKSPDHGQCWHLSMAFWYPDMTVAPMQKKDTQEWVGLFFHPNANWVWTEPPYTPQGKRKGVYHYRLFADEHWQPIFPKGEVYSTLKTEKGWKSWSEVQDDIRKAEKAKQEHDNQV